MFGETSLPRDLLISRPGMQGAGNVSESKKIIIMMISDPSPSHLHHHRSHIGSRARTDYVCAGESSEGTLQRWYRGVKQWQGQRQLPDVAGHHEAVDRLAPKGKERRRVRKSARADPYAGARMDLRGLAMGLVASQGSTSLLGCTCLQGHGPPRIDGLRPWPRQKRRR